MTGQEGMCDGGVTTATLAPQLHAGQDFNQVCKDNLDFKGGEARTANPAGMPCTL